MSTSAAAYEQAIAHHGAGRLGEAEAGYREILAADPRHADAWHLLGLVYYQTGKSPSAAECVERAIALRGDQPAYYCNLGEIYRSLRRSADAAQSQRQALRLRPSYPQAYNNLGLALRELGQIREAQEAYRHAIELQPDFSEPYNNLGISLMAEQNMAGAIDCFRSAVRHNPQFAAAHDNLGLALTAAGQLAQAVEHTRRAVELSPRTFQFQINLGALYHRLQRYDEAAACGRMAVQLNPQSALAHNNLAEALRQQGQHADALSEYRAALELDPRSAELHCNLAIALAEMKDAGGAVEACRQALRLRPDFAEPLSIGFNQLLLEGRHAEAAKLCDEALATNPQFAMAHFHRGNIHQLTGNPPAAAESYQEALRLDPTLAAAYSNLASALNDLVRPDQVIEICHRGQLRAPKDAALYANLAVAELDVGRFDNSIAAWRRAIELSPNDAANQSNYLYALNFHPAYDPPAIHAEHLKWAARHAEPLTTAAPPLAVDRSPERRLRVGYLSPFFRSHAVMYFAEPMIAAHTHENFEITCYSDCRGEGDAATARLRATVDRWRTTAELTPEQVAQQVRDDQIDILVDLSGHIGGNRLLVFARKPAPIQVTYLGYQNTTGMTAMDYRLTDAQADPPGQSEQYYTEQLVRLPRAFFCYRPADDLPVAGPLPALARGQVTFGSFNNYAKVTPWVVEAWLKILERVAGSRLLVISQRGGHVERHWHKLAQERGIDPARIELFDRQPHPKYMDLLSQVDIALDPFPFNGHTTTCDAVWMGVPVVMLRGGTYASRFGASVHTNVGLDDWIASDIPGYIDLAVAKAADRESLALLRGQLRARMAASPILDFAGFTRNLEAEYRAMWRRFCAGGAA